MGEEVEHTTEHTDHSSSSSNDGPTQREGGLGAKNNDGGGQGTRPTREEQSTKADGKATGAPGKENTGDSLARGVSGQDSPLRPDLEKAADTVNSVVDTVTDTVNNVADTITGTANTVADTITGTANTVVDTIAGTANTVADTVTDAKNDAAQVIDDAKDSVVRTVNDVTQQVKDIDRQASDQYENYDTLKAVAEGAFAPKQETPEAGMMHEAGNVLDGINAVDDALSGDSARIAHGEAWANQQAQGLYEGLFPAPIEAASTFASDISDGKSVGDAATHAAAEGAQYLPGAKSVEHFEAAGEAFDKGDVASGIAELGKGGQVIVSDGAKIFAVVDGAVGLGGGAGVRAAAAGEGAAGSAGRAG
ncbi:MAG: hypothetical protein QOG65_3713, partial [Actinomycetota bacterium]|nr:hypothetical protein [Actinomycetota bacterium]